MINKDIKKKFDKNGKNCRIMEYNRAKLSILVHPSLYLKYLKLLLS